jgi:hypothetical protein
MERTTKYSGKEFQARTQDMGLWKSEVVFKGGVYDMRADTCWGSYWGHRKNTRDKKLNRHTRIKPPWKR